MSSRAVGREGHCKQMSLVCMGSARSVSATLGLPLLMACAFPVHTAQATVCSAGELSKVGPGVHALLRSKLLRFRFLGTPQRRRLGWACVLHPSQVRAARVTRCLTCVAAPSLRLRLLPSPTPASQFFGCTVGTPSQVCCVSLLGS